jgi:dephospho-CoA kinase
MPAIGITGAVATGKSTFCDYLQRFFPNVKFFDADRSAHELVELDDVKTAISAEFGPEFFLPSGGLNRVALRAIVFSDAAKRRALEQILHPRIRRQWSALAETHRNAPDFFFADIPLLYETNGEKLCDRVVVVACSREIQLGRLMNKKSLSQDEAERMINTQMPLAEKISRADHVVWNNGERSGLKEQVQLLAALWSSEKWTSR